MNAQASSPPELAALPRLFFAALGWTVLIALGPGGVMGGDPHPAALLGVAGVSSFAEIIRHRNLMVYSDNTGAEAATRKGACALRC